MGQGTIKHYDPVTHSGVILDDAKAELTYTLDSFKGTGMREFRIGQRVKFELQTDADGERVVRDLRVVTL